MCDDTQCYERKTSTLPFLPFLPGVPGEMEAGEGVPEAEGDVWAITVDHLDARLVNVSLDYFLRVC